MISLNKYNTYHESTANTKKGIHYDVPCGMSGDYFNQLIEEFVTHAKIKGLTIRQAQFLFEACSDYILESTVN